MRNDVIIHMQNSVLCTVRQRKRQQSTHWTQADKLPSGESTLRPDERLPLGDEFFSGKALNVDNDWEILRFRFDLGAKRVLSLDFFFTSEGWLSDCVSASASLSTETRLEEETMADAESENPSFFLRRTLSFSLEMRELGLSCIERSSMLAEMLFLRNWTSSSTSPRGLSSFPVLSTSLNQL